MWRAWITLEFFLLCSSTHMEIALLWRSWNTWIIARKNIEECIKRFLCEAAQKIIEREAYIQLWHTERSEYAELYIGRSEAQKKKKVHNRWSMTFFVHVLFRYASHSLFFFISHSLTSLEALISEFFFFFCADRPTHENKLCVCVFSGKAAWGEVFPSLRLDYNIILLLCCSFSLSKMKFFECYQAGGKISAL